MKNDPFTLLIALSSKSDAHGEVYVDDENSFNFKYKNEFIHRKLQQLKYERKQ